MQRRIRTVKPVEDRRILGIVLVLITVGCFAGVDTSAKWLVLSGVPPLEAVFARYAVHLVIILAVFLPMHGPALFASGNRRLEIGRAMALMLSTVANFIAVRYLPLTVTGTILFAMPLILSVLAIPLLGEHVGWRRWIAIVVGFVGVVAIMRPGGASFHWAMLLSLGCTCLYALYGIATRKLAGVDHPETQQVYPALVATVAVLPFALAGWVWPDNAAGWAAFFLMGVFAGIGHFLLTIAYRLAPASVLAPFVYPQLLYMVAASWFIFGEPPDIAVYIGAPVIVGAGLYIWLRERRLAGDG